ncbi:hypothetical protein [Clostridium tertium]|uniref:Peptide synthase n=1 Tax=Clostridium tertium TaxID=1559 RepID=A0A6N3CNJ0_9CLOT
MKNHIYSERVDLFDPNIYINLVVEIIGNPNTEEVISAVKLAFKSNEATMSKITLDNNGEAYYEKISASGCKVECTNGDWRAIIKENEKIPFEIDKGELIRVFLINSSDKVILLVMAHHLVGDGKAITYFIEDIMKALSGEKLNYRPIKLITEESFSNKFKVLLPFKLYANYFNKKWSKTGRIFNWEDYYNVHKVYWNKRSSRVVYEHFSTEELSKIHSKAKGLGISVNSYILTAFLEADRDSSVIGMAVNIRKDNNKSISNQVSGISINHKFSDKKTFDENAIMIHKKVLSKLKTPAKKYFIIKFMQLFSPSLLDSIVLYKYGLYENDVTKKIAKVMGYVGDKTRDLGITNLTKLDIPNKYGNYEIKNVLFIPPVVSYAKHIIGVSTMNDGMNISYHFMSNEDMEKEIRFFKRGIKNLRN